MFQNVSLDDFQEFVRQTLERWHVPGAAIAVIKDGEVILSQGFGLRNLENQLPVTAQTLFPIARWHESFHRHVAGAFSR